MRFELTTSTLARLRSTPELRPLTMGSPAAPEAVIKRIWRSDARGKIQEQRLFFRLSRAGLCCARNIEKQVTNQRVLRTGSAPTLAINFGDTVGQ